MRAKTSPSPFNLPEIKVSFHSKTKPGERLVINNSQTACEIFKKYWDEDTVEFQEQAFMLLLNGKCELIGIKKIAMGGPDHVYCDARIIYGIALKSCAAYVVVAHCHPSGNLNPSEGDIRQTHKLKAAGEILNIHLVDHLILTKDGFFSMADEKLMDLN
jgi:DNA repair protein RadC